MKPKTDIDEVQNFYNWSRDYWIELSRSSEGKIFYALNFGLWMPDTENLYEAQVLFWEKIASLFGELSENTNGLEIGCGIGGFAVKLAAEKNVRLTCLDLMTEHLTIAQQNAKHQGVDSQIDFLQGDAISLPREDNTFDFIYCIESSFHYPDKQKFLQEVYRVLKNKGIFIIADMTCEDNSLVKFRKGNYFLSSSAFQTEIEKASFHILKKMDIGDKIFEPLKNHIKNHNRGQRNKLARYWELVLYNYTQLFKQGKMAYEIFQLVKN
jgi:ubiquinone/menaquinone biosynthesis C-methylase UbiE